MNNCTNEDDRDDAHCAGDHGGGDGVVDGDDVDDGDDGDLFVHNVMKCLLKKTNETNTLGLLFPVRRSCQRISI